MSRWQNFWGNIGALSVLSYPIWGLVTGAFVVKHAEQYAGCTDAADIATNADTLCVGFTATVCGIFWPVWWVWNLAHWWLP